MRVKVFSATLQESRNLLCNLEIFPLRKVHVIVVEYEIVVKKVVRWITRYDTLVGF